MFPKITHFRCWNSNRGWQSRFFTHPFRFERQPLLNNPTTPSHKTRPRRCWNSNTRILALFLALFQFPACDMARSIQDCISCMTPFEVTKNYLFPAITEALYAIDFGVRGLEGVLKLQVEDRIITIENAGLHSPETIHFAHGQPYHIRVNTQPDQQFCIVPHDVGVMPAGRLHVDVFCGPGDETGLQYGLRVIAENIEAPLEDPLNEYPLRLRNDNQDHQIAQSGEHILYHPYKYRTRQPYQLEILQHPRSRHCELSGPITGIIAAPNTIVENIIAKCVPGNQKGLLYDGNIMAEITSPGNPTNLPNDAPNTYDLVTDGTNLYYSNNCKIYANNTDNFLFYLTNLPTCNPGSDIALALSADARHLYISEEASCLLYRHTIDVENPSPPTIIAGGVNCGSIDPANPDRIGGMALSGDYLYFSEPVLDKIRRLNLTTDAIDSFWEIYLGTNTEPRGMVATPAGDVYFVDAEKHAVYRIDPGGSWQVFAGTPGISGSTDGPVSMAQFTSPTNIAFDGVNLYVVENNLPAGGMLARLRRIYPDASGVDQVETIASGPTLTDPKGLTATGDRLYLIDGNVIRYLE